MSPASFPWKELILGLAIGLFPCAAVIAMAWLLFDTNAPWIVGSFALAVVLAFSILSYRYGWLLLGPHFYYDVIRLARRGRSTLLRIAYISAMFVGLAYVYFDTHLDVNADLNEFARISDRFAFTLFLVQNLAIVILAPAYLGSAIAEEKERRTLELLFTTQLTDMQIVLGKLTSRIIHLMGFVLAGFPILSMIQFWGGIDLLLIAGNIANALLNILSIGSICLLISTLCRTVSAAVMISYAIILPFSFCCVAALQGFPFVLQDERMAGGARVVVVQDLAPVTVAHLTVTVVCLVLSVLTLRQSAPLGPDVHPDRPHRPGKREDDPERCRPNWPPRESDPLDFYSIPYRLPPVPDNPLYWKERYLHRGSYLLSPMILTPAFAMLAMSIPCLLVVVIGWLCSESETRGRDLEAWSYILRFFYYLFLGCYTLGVSYRAASSIARERQQQTLEPLLLLPIDRREILLAKLYGSLWHGWPWLVPMAFNILLGVVLGAYHPFSAVILCVAPWPMVLWIATLGLSISVRVQTVVRAAMYTLILSTIPLWFTLGALRFGAFTVYDMPEGELFIAVGLLLFCLPAAYASWKVTVYTFEKR